MSLPDCPRGVWRRDNAVVASELQEVFFFVGVFVCLFVFFVVVDFSAVARWASRSEHVSEWKRNGESLSEA